MATASAFGFSAFDPFGTLIEHSINGKYQTQMAKNMAQLQYEYAQRYAENNPSWQVKGLRAAGINPIIAFGGGSGVSSPSMPTMNNSILPSNSSSSAGGSGWFDPLTRQQIKAQKLDNELREDNLLTIKAENEVRRLKAEAEAGLLRPVSNPLEGDGKSVGVLIPSETFKAFQKSIKDNYDLGSEKYIRETVDKVFKYGTEILDALPKFQRNAILKQLPNFRKGSFNSSGTVEPYIRNAPSSNHSTLHKITKEGGQTVFHYD